VVHGKSAGDHRHKFNRTLQEQSLVYISKPNLLIALTKQLQGSLNLIELKDLLFTETKKQSPHTLYVEYAERRI